MPTVPTYERQILPKPAPEPGTTSDAFGIRLGQAVSEFGRQVGQSGKELAQSSLTYQNKLDKARARDVLNQAIQADREYMGEQFQRKGANAIGVYDHSKAYFSERTRHWSGELDNEQQRQLFLNAYNPRVNSYLNASYDHQTQQQNVYDQATQQAFITNSAQDAIMFRDNPEFIEESRMEIESAVRSLPSNEGLDGQAMTAQVDEAVGAFYSKVIEAKTVDNPTAAKEYYDSVKEKIPAQFHTKIEASLKDNVLRQESLIKAEQIAAQTDNFTERNEMVREIKDANLQDLVRQRIKIINGEEKNAEIRLREDDVESRVGRIMASGDLQKSYDIALGATNPQDRLSLYQTATAIWGQGPKTDYAKLVEAYQDIDNQAVKTPNQFIAKYRKYLSNADFQKAFEYYQAGGYLKEIRHGQVSTAFTSVMGKTPKDAPKEFAATWDYVVDNFPKGTKPTSDSIRKLVSEGIALGKTKGERESSGILGKIWYRGLGENMTYSEAVKQGVERQWLPLIENDEEEQLIIQQIKAHNKENPDKAPIELNDRNIREYKKRLIKKFGSTEVLYNE